jgi:OOP family OmpA-OmpF porin
MKKRLLAALGLAAACFSLPAAAQLDTSALYVGLSVGGSHFTDVCVAGFACDDRDTEFSLFGGYQFNRYLALEAGYRDFGSAHVGPANFKANALEGDLVGTYPLLGGLGVLGRVGVYSAKVKGDGVESKKTGLTYGLGAYYDTSPRFGFRAEYQRYNKASNKDDIGFATDLESVLALSAVFRFR